MGDSRIMSLKGETAARSLSHDEYYKLAEARLPDAALGIHKLPKDVRFVVRRGEGSRLQDVRGRWYIDYVSGAGALILGHAHPEIVEAMTSQVGNGTHYFGTLNELAIQLADELVEAIPCAEKIIFTTTGSEATFYAMRIARAHTRRNKVLKFEGAYHGNHDYSGVSVFPTSAANYPVGQLETGGIPDCLPPTVLVAPYNDIEAVERIVSEHAEDLAAIIVEPLQRIIVPSPEFLSGLRRLCDRNGIVLIFDEVVTGFRLAYGGGQEMFGIKPDLAAYGKIVGGGAALGCVGGRSDLISLTDPQTKGKPNYALINGTFHANPLAAAAGLATLRQLRAPGFYQSLHRRAETTFRAFQEVLNRHGVPAYVAGQASFWQILFLDREPKSQADLMAADASKSRALDLELLRNGIYVVPNVRRFVSAVHNDRDVETTVEALDAACRKVRFG